MGGINDVNEAILLERLQYEGKFEQINPAHMESLARAYKDILPECFSQFPDPTGEVKEYFNQRVLSNEDIFARLRALSQKDRMGRVRKGVKYEK